MGEPVRPIQATSSAMQCIEMLDPETLDDSPDEGMIYQYHDDPGWDERVALAIDDGTLPPIQVTKDGKIRDGRRRNRAAKRHKRMIPAIRTAAGADREGAVLANQYRRKNPGELYAESLYWRERLAREDEAAALAAKKAGAKPPKMGETDDRIAAILEISRGSLEQLKSVMSCEDGRSPELRELKQKLRSDELTIGGAHAKMKALTTPREAAPKKKKKSLLPAPSKQTNEPLGTDLQALRAQASSAEPAEEDERVQESVAEVDAGASSDCSDEGDPIRQLFAALTHTRDARLPAALKALGTLSRGERVRKLTRLEASFNTLCDAFRQGIHPLKVHAYADESPSAPGEADADPDASTMDDRDAESFNEGSSTTSAAINPVPAPVSS